MKRLALLPATLALSLVLAPPAAASGPTCAELLGMANHGEHVLGLYVVGGSLSLGYWPPAGGVGESVSGDGAAIPGGPGPGYHVPNGFAPGASFCVDAASPGMHVGH